ncbi:MAG: hypothetical protein V4805_11175 [Pseudomonadota bacterium]
MREGEHINTRRCLLIGQELISGPTALYPPQTLDDSGWLEPDLRITLFWPGWRKIESIIVYADDTMNRENDFLDPMIRHCVWDRKNDWSGKNAWPSVEISIGF